MELTESQLKQMVPGIPYVDHWQKALSILLPDYEINTPKRMAAFVAQCAHEVSNLGDGRFHERVGQKRRWR